VGQSRGLNFSHSKNQHSTKYYTAPRTWKGYLKPQTQEKRTRY